MKNLRDANAPKRYFTGKPCKRGHISERLVSNGTCVECANERLRKYFADNPDKADERRKYSAAYLAEHREENRARSMAYFNAHKKEASEKRSMRRKANPSFKLACYLRSRIYGVLRGNVKGGSMVRDLGCSIEQFKAFVANKFHSGMNWDNWGSVWQLDHIRPLASFNLVERNQFLLACYYTNYQPLLIADHKIKTANDIAALREAA